MIIQFDRHKATQGAGPTDHVWKIGLSSSELAALHSVVHAAQHGMDSESPGKVLGENLLFGLQAVLEQVQAGKLYPIVTIRSDDNLHAPPPPPLPVVLTGQGQYAQAWPPEPEAPAAKATPATIPYPENGDHACYCPTN